MKYTKYLPIVLLLFSIIVFAKPFIVDGKLPIPADTIVGLYHPFRDLYTKEYPRGLPFKNSLITDPVRQQYPWRFLAVYMWKRFELPLWNPYNGAGTPLLANVQSAALYPLNFIFVLLPFNYAWSLLVLLQPLLAGIFLFFYLKKINLHPYAAGLGATVFAFSGFSVAWLEWNTVVHTALWLPLILLAKEYLLQRISVTWVIVLIFAEVSQLFAGHIQIWFYSFIISNVYLLARILQISFKENKINHNRFIHALKNYTPFLFIGIGILILTFFQWIPTLQLLQQSARDIDLNWHKEGWFIPWQHLVQFLSPDFFGNPSTLNYWGVWNYGELVGYIGILPLLLVQYVLFFRYDKKTFFFGSLFFLSLLFSLQTLFAKLPFILHLPFFSTAQPTRLLFVTNFSLAILAALGLDYFLRKNNKIFYPVLCLGILFSVLWLFVSIGMIGVKPDDVLVAQRNLVLPTVLFVLVSSGLLLKNWVSKKYSPYIIVFLLLVTVFDLVRFTNKFTPFTDSDYLYPSTKAIAFLQKQPGQFRIMTTDDRILPPNFSLMYKLQSVDIYDPLYLRRYGELIAASERGRPDISPPFGFNRIITPHVYNSKIIDLLGVRYILSLSDITDPMLHKVFQEGQTQIYENANAFSRAFFVEDVQVVKGKQEAIEKIFAADFDARKLALVEKNFLGVLANPPPRWKVGRVDIISYTENEIILQTKNNGDGFLVLTDSYYPTWHAVIDGKETQIYRTDYNFRGVIIPEGKHEIKFYNTLF